MAFDRSTARPVDLEGLSIQYGHEAPKAQDGALSLLDKATQDTEAKIAGRPSRIREILNDPGKAFLNTINPAKNPLAGLGPVGVFGGPVLGAAQEFAESVPANIGLGIQQRKPVADIASDTFKGMVGERPAQLGDIMRGVGAPEPIAAGVGLAASAAPFMASGIGKRVSSEASRAITAPGRDIANVATFGGRQRLAKRATEIVEKAEDFADTKFGQQIDALSAKHAADPKAPPIDLRPAIQRFQALMQDHPGLQKQLTESGGKEGADLLNLVLNDPTSQGIELFKSVTLKDAQMIKRAITGLAPVARSASKSDVYGLTQELRGVRNMIRNSEVSAVPDLADKFADYKKIMDNVDIVQPHLKVGRRGQQIFGSSSKLLGDVDVRPAFKDLAQGAQRNPAWQKANPAGLSGRPDVFADVLGAGRTAATGRFLQRAEVVTALSLLSGAISGATFYALNRRRGGGGSSE